MRRGDTSIARLVFLVGMAMLGVAAAIVLLRHPDFLRPKSQPAVRHHTLDSPYIAGRFTRGQAQGQTNTALGRAFPKNLGIAYRAAGYEWLSVTDANTLTPTKTYSAPGLVALPGADVGYSFAHFLAYDIDHIEQAITPQGAIDWIHNNAGAAFLARPLQPPALDFRIVADLQRLDDIEILDARLAKDDPIHADATALWDRLLSDHHRVWGIVGDDTADDHGRDSTLGKTAVDVQVADTDPVLIEDALRRGAFVDSAGVRVLGVSVSGDTITVVTADGDGLSFIGTGGKVLKTTEGARGEYKVNWNEGYVRVLATRRDGGRAWTQPIIVNP